MPVTLRLLTPLLFLFANSLTAAPPSKLEIKKDDHICFIGNSLAVRLSQPGHTQFESLIYQRFPKHDLVIRNLAWPADEVALRPRTDGFGTPDENLAAVKADVIIAFFGFNESFKGEAGLEPFKADLDAWIVHTQQQNYSGKGAPRIALIGPVKPSGFDNAEEAAHNVWLYSETMKIVAAKHSVLFADLFGGPMLVFTSPQSDAVVRHDGLAATLTRPPEMVILRNNNNNRVHFTTTPGGDSMSEALVSSQAWNISSHALALRLEKLLFEPTRPDWASERFWQAGEVRLSTQPAPGSQAANNQTLGSTAQYYNTHPGISLVSPIEGHQERIGLAGNSNGWRLLSRPGMTSDSSPRQVELTNGKDIVKYLRPLPFAIQTLIAQRDQLWQQRYRIVDSYYTYGGRSDLKFADGDQTNREVMQREREVLDVMIANRDKRIWDLVRREVIEERNDWSTLPEADGLTAKERAETQRLWTKIDDSNVPPFLQVKTFFGTGKKTDAGQNTGMTSKTAEPDAIKFLTPEEEKKTFTLAKGYEANCFASEREFPDLGNAVAMAFDVRGRLWVSDLPELPAVEAR